MTVDPTEDGPQPDAELAGEAPDADDDGAVV
jgi:hypothetical protein